MNCAKLKEVYLVGGFEINREEEKDLISWSVKDQSRSNRLKPQCGRYKLSPGKLSSDKQRRTCSCIPISDRRDVPQKKLALTVQHYPIFHHMCSESGKFKFWSSSSR